MRTILALFIVLFVALLGPVVALAQDVVAANPAPPIDLSLLFGSAAALAAFAAAVVQFIRMNVWKTLDGLAIVALTWALCVAVSVLGYYLNATSFTAIGQAIAFGVSAGLLANGGVGLAAKISASTKQLPTTTPQ